MIGPELDGGVSVGAKVVSIEALGDTEQAVLTLSLEELPAGAVGGTPLNLWEVLSKCRKPCGQGVLRTPHLGIYRLWRDAGFAIGAILAGVVADIFGLIAALWAVAALTVTSGLVVAIRLYETLPKPSRAVEGALS